MEAQIFAVGSKNFIKKYCGGQEFHRKRLWGAQILKNIYGEQVIQIFFKQSNIQQSYQNYILPHPPFNFTD